MAPKYLDGRQASPTTANIVSSVLRQPTTVIPLTTTFTPPATCTAGILSMLPPPGFLIWANEPIPARNQTSSACYPPEFMKAYTSISSERVGSSIVPAMGNLACPKSFCTVFAANNNYLACCPSGYKFHPPETMVDSSRPAYGGTCYSDFTVSSTYTIVAYDSAGESRTQQFIASTAGAQAYAHPIDGFAATPAAIRCEADTRETFAANTDKNALSPGGIVGAVFGGLGGLAVLIALVVFMLRSQKNSNSNSKWPGGLHEISSSDEKPPNPFANILTAESKAVSVSAAEIGSSQSRLSEKRTSVFYEAHELSAHAITKPEPVYEVEANEKGNKSSVTSYA
ncbi:hypothetical protein B0J11DRAFT_146054 [Dendryphion nanum]|uniref:Uncharacterized protein n=1 Tax=Dendryphion nanum TaxID=256645 RepID=A0A9P9D614_9PLEO|nr:hypothetical protein B0J11DRAFT_146054 [Dendryphion nanum]